MGLHRTARQSPRLHRNRPGRECRRIPRRRRAVDRSQDCVKAARANGRSRRILLKKSLSRIREEYSVLGQFICARMIRIGYVARTIISQNRLYFAKFRLFQQYRRILVVAVRSGEGPFTEPTIAVRRRQRGPARHNRRLLTYSLASRLRRAGRKRG